MRLTEFQRKKIVDAVYRQFGSEAEVYLFGSRVNDSKKGGDIDLLIEADFSPEELFIRKIRTLSDLQLNMGDRKIDIVTYNRHTENNKPLIVKEAMASGIKL